MMKKFLVSLTGLLLAVAAVAVPAKRGLWRNLPLANGTEVRAELCGDEHASWFRAEDGRCFMKMANQAMYEEVSPLELKTRASQLMAEGRDAAQTEAPNRASYIGQKKCLVILAEFPDCPFTFGYEQHQQLVNQVNYTDEELGFVGSVRDWFYAQSYGNFDIEFDVAGPYMMSHNYAYYGEHSSWGGSDRRAGEMIKEAVQQANADVNYKDYDWDNDGEAELVFVIYAGRGEASGGNDDTIWPHKSSISSRFDNTYIRTYACSCELRGGGVNRVDPDEDETPLINGIGTICHEFSHCLGLPDYYDVDYTGFEGMGYWDVMCNGPYLGDSFIPCGYTAYEREYCGWLTMTELKNDSTVAEMPAVTESPVAYVMYNNANRNEFYVMENRQQSGWDAGLYGSGLLVYHVDYNKQVWNSNAVNTNSRGNDHERCTFVPADDRKPASSVSGIAGDLYPYKTNNKLSYNTRPATDIYAAWHGKNLMFKGLFNIERVGNLMKFDFRDLSSEVDGPQAPESAHFYESFFECMGTGGNDDQFGGSDVATSPFVPDNENWTANNAFGGLQCAKFGTGLVKGTATTPTFGLHDEIGLYELTFRSAPFKGDKNNSVKVEVLGDNAIIADEATMLDPAVREAMTQKTVTCTYAGQEQWTVFKVYIYGKGEVQLRFTAEKKRMFLDEILVLPGYLDFEGSAIELVEAEAAPAVRYNLQGQPVNAVRHGQIYIENGKLIRR